MLNKPEWLFPKNAFFENLFNNTKENTIIVMDIDATIIAVNKAFTDCFGYKPADIIGQKVTMLFTKEDQENGMPQKEILSVLNTGQGYDNNYLVSFNGDITWVSGESILVEDDEGRKLIAKVIQDIHKIKDSEASLSRMNDFNEAILSSIKDVVIVLDEKMNIISANKAFIKLFTTADNSSATQINFSSLIAPHDVSGELLNNIRQAITSRKNFNNIPIEIKTEEGELRIFDVSSSTMQLTGTNKNILLVIHDITLHKSMERSREDLIGFVAHELRNPLGNLVLCNDLIGELIKENKISEANEILQRSKNNVLRLNKMIAELYNVTKINSGNLTLEIATFNFDEMLREAIESIQALHPDYAIVVIGKGNIKVQGDKYRLIEVVTNYLSNGIKYSNGNTNVQLGINYDTNAITVSVKDEGLGISTEQLPYVFERYFRAENTRNLEGIGLGLYLCRRIIFAHGGRVWVESKEGKGSSFYFSIPLIQ
ncbi:MAG: PAS domain-containing sensor histidine kinase [Ferruginibacter sp.]|nr:PAS domain-containing sensor histidine kinase [Ferruginibacter sp.]